ncbi:MAG: aminotransferase class V-fold PLP-dependent enzyme [Cloacibacterium sp.]|nr:aminotransferase class V-fold PLP-dependent enzyme [Cloacibacterium sp.]
MKYNFKNDYSEGCHPRILEALLQNNLVQQNGYGLDEFCQNAQQIILDKINNPDAEVHFVSGGTQANLIVISSILKPHESVISAHTGHIYTNEAGAIEATGHKVHGVETPHGKLTPQHIQNILQAHTNKPHQLKQKLVYISNSTEIGTIYNKEELQILSDFCKKNQLYLFMDGARLGHALTAENNDLSLEDVAKFTDIFYLGGTKNGALIGEAIVINNPNLQEDFGFHLKQRGAMLAKGRLLGIQFQELLKDELYFDLARHANQQAMKLKKVFEELRCVFLSETFTNQIFPILPQSVIQILAQDYGFYVWRTIDEQYAAIRLITSWATEDAAIESFSQDIRKAFRH